MSFGEHLEELRRAVFKSVLALFVGFLVGLYFGTDIVDYIQKPLRGALENFYLRQAEAKQAERVEELKARGEHIATAEELAKEGLLPEEIYLSYDDVAAAFKDRLPEVSKSIAESAPKQDNGEKEPSFQREDMIRLRVFRPMEEDARLKVIALGSQEPFAVYIRTSFMAGLVIAAPFIFYFIWQFVAAGLYRQEQSYVYTYLPISLALFVAGAMLAFYFAFRPLLDFLLWFCEAMHIDPNLRLSDWISFVLLLPLGFGVSFQLPLMMLLLERIGIFTVEQYWQKWRAAVVVIAVIAMLMTPSPDPYSMLLMGVPLVGLYFGGIWLCRYMPGSGSATGRQLRKA